MSLPTVRKITTAHRRRNAPLFRPMWDTRFVRHPGGVYLEKGRLGFLEDFANTGQATLTAKEWRRRPAAGV
jgi:hypothetical protein